MNSTNSSGWPLHNSSIVVFNLLWKIFSYLSSHESFPVHKPIHGNYPSLWKYISIWPIVSMSSPLHYWNPLCVFNPTYLTVPHMSFPSILSMCSVQFGSLRFVTQYFDIPKSQMKILRRSFGYNPVIMLSGFISLCMNLSSWTILICSTIYLPIWRTVPRENFLPQLANLFSRSIPNYVITTITNLKPFYVVHLPQWKISGNYPLPLNPYILWTSQDSGECSSVRSSGSTLATYYILVLVSTT